MAQLKDTTRLMQERIDELEAALRRIASREFHAHNITALKALTRAVLAGGDAAPHEFDNEMQATGGDAIAARNRIRERRGFPEDATDNK